MKKNILLIVQNNSFPFDKRVFKEALTLKEANYNVSVISPRSDHDIKQNEIIDGIEVRRYRDRVADGGVFSYVFEYINSLVKIYILAFGLVLRKKINIIHVANPPDFFWPMALLCKLNNIKFIYDQHDLAPEISKSKFQNNLIFNVLLFNEKLSVKLSNGIIVVNTAFRDRLIDKWNMDPQKCEIVYNGPPEDFLPIENEVFTEKYKKMKIVLYVGLMTINDHIEVIINAANELINNSNRQDVHFILVGDGDVRIQMENMSAELGLSNNIEFTGIVDHIRVREYLNIADVCIAPDLPNELNEYLTLVKVLEYMKCSKAFVSFNLKETVNFAGDAGLYAENEQDFVNKIELLLDDPVLEKEMGKKGNTIVTNNYLWSHSAERLLKLYNRLN